MSENNNSAVVKDSDNTVIINTVWCYHMFFYSRSAKDLIINCLNSNFTVEEMAGRSTGRPMEGWRWSWATSNIKRIDSAKQSGHLALCNDVVEGLGILDQSNNMTNFVCSTDGIGSWYGRSYPRYREENASTGNEYGSRNFVKLTCDVSVFEPI